MSYQTPEWIAYCEWIVRTGRTRATWSGFRRWKRQQQDAKQLRLA